MGHQVSFYILPDDIAEIESAIGQLEPMRVLHSRSPSRDPRVLPSCHFYDEDAGHPWLSYYLVRECDLGDVVTRYVSAQGYWSIDSLRSPVMEFSSCYFDGEIIRRGRLYYVDGFYDEEAWIEKSEGFRHWAKAVLRVTKKRLERHDSDYVGRAASEWVDREGGRLVEL